MSPPAQGISRKVFNGFTKVKIELSKQAVKFGVIKPMQENKGDFRLRVGKVRIIFEYRRNGQTNSIVILKIGYRGEIYK